VADPNLALLIGMARAMGPLCDQVVFVGGCATGLLIDNASLMDVRPTEDVDAIVEVATLAGYHRLAGQLALRGFKQTMADNTPPFRWYWNRLQLDLVPLDEKVLGFANPWYRAGFDAAVLAQVDDGLRLRHLSAVNGCQETLFSGCECAVSSVAGVLSGARSGGGGQVRRLR